MLTIKYTARFKRDYKREKKSGKHKKELDTLLVSVIDLLAQNQVLPAKFCDHPLSGEWNDHRDCHLKPDLVLIYKKDKIDLSLVRLGSHSELAL